MYQNIFFNKEDNKIHLWDDKKGYRKFPYKRYGYIKDSKGTHVALDGTKVKKIGRWKNEDENIPNKLYETDVKPETRALIDIYKDSDNVSVNHNILFLDIEVSSEYGFSRPDNPQGAITAITIYSTKFKKYYVFVLDPKKQIKDIKTNTVEMYSFVQEKNLLISFIRKWRYLKPTIVSGWYSDDYDIPYIYNRGEMVIGKEAICQLSPIGIINYNAYTGLYTIAGISSLDYMKLYKFGTDVVKASYSLDNVSKEELGYGKIKFPGSIDDLYNNNIVKFVKYNIHDVTLLVKLDLKLEFVDLVLNICHKGHVPYEYIYSPSKTLDGAALTYLKRNNIVAPNSPKSLKMHLLHDHEIGATKLYLIKKISKKIPTKGSIRIKKSKSTSFSIPYINYIDNYFILENSTDEFILKEYELVLEFVGAFVKQPTPGLYEWLYDLDLKALYPSLIISLNISPETKVGKVLNWNAKEFANKDKKDYNIQLKTKRIHYDYDELDKYFRANNYCIASNGVFYSQDKIGFLPAILSVWFDERDEYKRLRDEAYKDGNQELGKFYNLRQKRQKVLLNSFYGLLGMVTFRFYDLDNAEGITTSGQEVILRTQYCANQFYNELLAKYKLILDDGTTKILNSYDSIEINENGTKKIIKVKELKKNDIIY